MAETAGMNFTTPTSYSSPYTLCGLSRLLVPFYIRNFLHHANNVENGDSTPTLRVSGISVEFVRLADGVESCANISVFISAFP